jgi:hypothetical protein
MTHRLLASLLAWAALASCAQPTPSVPAPSTSPGEAARLEHELRTLIGPAACNSNAQCRTVAVGAKACGGPSGFLAWSTEGTDAARVTDLAARQAAAQRRENEAGRLVSNCAMVTDPGAACVAGRCRLGSSNPALQSR